MVLCSSLVPNGVICITDHHWKLIIQEIQSVSYRLSMTEGWGILGDWPLTKNVLTTGEIAGLLIRKIFTDWIFFWRSNWPLNQSKTIFDTECWIDPSLRQVKSTFHYSLHGVTILNDSVRFTFVINLVCSIILTRDYRLFSHSRIATPTSQENSIWSSTSVTNMDLSGIFKDDISFVKLDSKINSESSWLIEWWWME